MTGVNRLTRKGMGSGRLKKRLPKRHNYNERLGGIPMKIKNGKIDYAWKKPIHRSWREQDTEELEREQVPLSQGEGSFVRRHIYEMRFGIEDETDDERRKREYKEWWEENQKV